MATKYFINLEQVSLTKYKSILEKSELLPGRRILYERINERFDSLMKRGIKDLNLLVQELKSPDKMKQLSKETKILTEYLTILKREINRLLPKPVFISDFPGIEKSIITMLNKKGIKNTLQLFDYCDTKSKREAISQELSISISDLDELTKLSDFSGIWGVGPIFCRIF